MKGLRVLIAEEERGVARLLDVLMRGKGCETDIAPNGLRAIEIARDNHPDLILLDLMMPIKDGVEVFDELRSDPATANIPVVMLTTQETLDLLPHPGVAHVMKPFELRGLDAAVQHALLSNVRATG